MRQRRYSPGSGRRWGRRPAPACWGRARCVPCVRPRVPNRVVVSAIEASRPECSDHAMRKPAVSAHDDGMRIDARRAETPCFCQRVRCAVCMPRGGTRTCSARARHRRNGARQCRLRTTLVRMLILVATAARWLSTWRIRFGKFQSAYMRLEIPFRQLARRASPVFGPRAPVRVPDPVVPPNSETAVCGLLRAFSIALEKSSEMALPIAPNW